MKNKTAPQTELTEMQSQQLRRHLKKVHYIKKSVIENGINQVLAGTWSTARLKASPDWVALPEDVRVNVSGLLNLWTYKAAGGTGTSCQSMSITHNASPISCPSQFKFHL